MAHFRSDGLGLTLAGGRVIILDLKADRYFGLAEQPEAIVRAQIEARPYAARHLPLSIGSRVFEIIEDVPATASLLDGPLPVPRPWAIASVVAARSWAALQLRWQPLRMILAGLAWRKSRLGDASVASRWDERAILPVIAAFETSGRVVSGHDRCLSVSLALASTLIRRGYAVELVIGVSGAPFAAHAWVQYGPVLLGDRLDRVRRFSPLLTI